MRTATSTAANAFRLGYLQKVAADSHDRAAILASLGATEDDLHESDGRQPRAEERAPRSAPPTIIRMEEPQQYKSRTGAYLASLLPMGSTLYAGTKSRDMINNGLPAGIVSTIAGGLGTVPGSILATHGDFHNNAGTTALGVLLSIAGAIVANGEATYRMTDAPHVRERHKAHTRL